jgi:hypothetical protein
MLEQGGAGMWTNGRTMRSGRVWAAAIICAGLFATGARAETLAELVKKEEGVEFGVCALTLRPSVAGKDVHVVVPARFPDPGIWVTRTLLFVGVDDGKNVAGVAEAKMPDDVAPREVISVSCNNDTVTVRMTDRMTRKTLVYAWDGKQLRQRGGKK